MHTLAHTQVIDGPDGYINPALDVAATGRIGEVSRQGTLSPERTKTRKYEFPVF
jgi:hypothetical protein